MSLTNPDKVVTEERLSEFYQQILPYMGGMSQLCIGGGYAPIGTIITFMGTTAPGSYLACDGTVYNISEYPLLADFFDAQFGAIDYFGGDGTTTFAVPDLRGEFLRGTGTNGHTNSITTNLEGSGANVGVHQEATADVAIGSYQTNTDRHYTAYNFTDQYNRNYDSVLTVSNYKYFKNGSTNTSEGQTIPVYYTSRPTNTSVLYCIKAETENSYSTTEKIVGTWIDGKPLYQKTFIGTTPSTVNSSNNIPIGSSIDVGLIVSAFLDDNVGNSIPISPMTRNATDITNLRCLIMTNTSSAYPNTIQIRHFETSSENIWLNVPVYITIQYTKTTD